MCVLRVLPQYVRWSCMTYEKVALGFPAMLKENSNIEKLKTKSFFSNYWDCQILKMRIMPQVEHNY